MCLAIPVQIETVLDNNQAIVNLSGVKTEISIALIDDVQAGDYVILHVGYALNKLDQAEAEATLALFASGEGEIK
jgi:hydrogenase expression/formation protein HypC